MIDNSPYVLSHTHEHITTLTLNRPQQFNALSEKMILALMHELDAILQDDTIRVVILAAAGKAFCAGHHLKEMRANHTFELQKNLFALCSQLMMKLIQLPQPIIAQVQGIATAAGCQLVAMCDLAMASHDASFALSGINVGLFCATPTVALSRNVGRKKAFEIMSTGEFIDAKTAEQMGLINHAVPHSDLQEKTLDLAQKIASKAPLAIRYGKGLFYQQLELSMADAYTEAVNVMAHNVMTLDAKEGIDAFIEKRTPVWQGK